MHQKSNAPTSKAVSVVTTTSTVANRGGGLNLSAMLTDGTLPESLTISAQYDLLTSIEARLAQEMRDLADALTRFSIGTQRINEELPLTAEFGQLITCFFSMASLQLANALLKDGDKPLLLDDGAIQLQKLGLNLHEFIREIDLEGRKFLAVALIDKGTSNLLDGIKRSD
ncbi:hypothetical protein RC84_01120 [Pectobacterium carotovorum subsp. carotovorum]|nr:hypothetical protein RC84_01120 [Pectobacterium carotovorum subsp. carotovorum]